MTLETLVRSDKNAKKAETYTGFEPVTKYYCISYLGDKAGKPVYMKYHAGITVSYKEILKWLALRNNEIKA